MSAGDARQSAIARLLSLLKQPIHDYRPATQVFLDLNIGRLADELQLARHGAERGGHRRRSCWSTSYDAAGGRLWRPTRALTKGSPFGTLPEIGSGSL